MIMMMMLLSLFAPPSKTEVVNVQTKSISSMWGRQSADNTVRGLAFVDSEQKEVPHHHLYLAIAECCLSLIVDELIVVLNDG